MSLSTPYFDALRQEIAALGGMFNAHLHLDRSGTLAIEGGRTAAVSYVSLSKKHGLIPAIHNSPAYDPANLKARTTGFIDTMVGCGTTRADSVVDVTADRVGMTAFDVFRSLSTERRGEIDFRIGAYSPLGFTDAEPVRWELLEAAAGKADFIGSLPERDDHVNYPDHIGFGEHCCRVIDLALRLDKPVHIHVDQRNDPRENGAEQVLDLLRDRGFMLPKRTEPAVWFVHVISPSTYDERRFDRLLAGLSEYNIGVICCPSAALSMRQLRPLSVPAFNSIARILEMLAAGIHVRLGSDNLCDVTSPAGSPDLLDEVFVLANALRFYDVSIMAQLAAGRRLDPASRLRVQQHLEHDREEVANVIRHYGNP